MVPILQCIDLCSKYKGNNKCEAFKDAVIPDDILMGKFDHTKPYPGDNGICFSPINNRCKAMQKDLFEPEEVSEEDKNMVPCD
jgi:hypothetical protein